MDMIKEVITDQIKSQVTTEFNKLTPPQRQDNTVWGDAIRTKNLFGNKSALVVKPDAHGNNISATRVRKLVTDNRIPVNSVIESDNGELFVNLPDEQSRDAVGALLNDSGNTVVKLKAKLPTVTVMGMTAREMKDADGNDFTASALEADIIKQNKPISDLIDGGSHLKVVYIKAPAPDQQFYTVAIRLSPEIRIALFKNRNRLHVGVRVHYVNDRFYVRRCNRCQLYGHFEDKCQSASPICGFCTESHASDECQLKNSPHTDHKCSNCNAASLNANGHPAFWTKCPSYVAQQDKIKKSICFDYNLLN